MSDLHILTWKYIFERISSGEKYSVLYNYFKFIFNEKMQDRYMCVYERLSIEILGENIALVTLGNTVGRKRLVNFLSYLSVLFYLLWRYIAFAIKIRKKYF